MEIEILSACGIFKGFSEDEIKAVLQKMNGRKNILQRRKNIFHGTCPKGKCDN